MTQTMDDELIAEFVVESNEHLADIENQLLSMEAAGADVDSELVNTVFRGIHSIKGAAGFFALTTINTLAHRMENVLNQIRNSALVPTSQVVDVLLHAADTLQSLLRDTATSNDVDVAHHLTALDSLVDAEANAAPTATAGNGESASKAPAAATEPRAMAGDTQSGTADPAAETPSTGGGDPPTVTHPQPNHAAAPAAPAPAPAAALADTPQRSKAERPETAASSADQSIRVPVGVLDQLMNLAGELVLSRNRLIQVVSREPSRALEGVVAGLDQVTSELQEAIMQTRMQPIGNVFGRFRRIVRDLSAKLGKECRVEIDGSEVEVDKSILESIGDPLTHLIRNAVDHGLETPAERQAAGKPACGLVHLRAFHQAGKVNITVRDDGHGIDAERLKGKALARGLISAEQAANMSNRDAVRLIFHAGFSTAENVSDVSGRGVGMDVVRTNIEKLGGMIEIETEVGTGTTIDIRLPLTLAIVPSLVVGCGGRRFAIPQTNINELVRIKRDDPKGRIERLKGAEVFRLRGVLLPLLRLEQALQIDTATRDTEPPETLYIIVVEAGSLRYGLVADALHDSEEIVVKPLGRHLQTSSCLAGATILGDGTVALILDVAALAADMQLSRPTEPVEQHAGDHNAETTDCQTVLLMRNHPAEQFAVPMEMVRRLERIRADQIDTVGGREILQYRGGTLPLLRVEHLVSAAPAEAAEVYYIVVFGVTQREVGLLVSSLVDVHQIGVDLDTTVFHEPGVLGATLFDGVPTRLLDLYELTKMARPDWFENDGSMANREGGTLRVLVAEDSDFFRKQLVRFLEGDGYEVVDCEDGQTAWERLQEEGDQIDVVVTDVEMPRMTGFELTRHIKADTNLSRLPVIAVTSLASEEDIQRGKEAGVDAYHVKLDQETLLTAVAECLCAVSRGKTTP